MNPSRSANPKEINISREKRELRVRWQDGHESAYGFDFLRTECPCAVCSDRRNRLDPAGGLALSLLTGPVIKAGEIQVSKVKPVGRYAINFVWSDGHDSGIYSYDVLRAACPCPTCRTG